MGFGSRPESGRRVQGSRWQIWLELLHVGPSYRCPCDRLGHHSLASRWFGRYCARGWGGGCLRAGCFDRIFRELFGLGCWGTTPCARCHSSMMSIRTLLLTTSMLSAPPPPPPAPPHFTEISGVNPKHLKYRTSDLPSKITSTPYPLSVCHEPPSLFS